VRRIEQASGDIDYLTNLVRNQDRPRYYSCLFAPSDKRDHLYALYAMNAEICRIPSSVAEPGLGEIRLQWWRDAILAADGKNGDTPVMRRLTTAMETCRLPAEALAQLVDAHSHDLYGDPWSAFQDLEAYYGRTDSALFQLASLVLGSNGAETAEAAGHAGIAYGLTRQLGSNCRLRSHGRQLASADLMEIYGIDPATMFLENPPDGFEALLNHLLDTAGQHFDQAKTAVRSIPAQCRPAFLPLAIVPAQARQISAAGAGLWREPVVSSDLSVLWRICQAGVFGL
jgi:phytoene synthase